MAVVRRDVVLMGKEPGDHRGEAGTAEAARDVASREHQGFRCELVQVRSANDLAAHEAVVGPPLVVADDHEDVRRFDWLRGAGSAGHMEQDA